MFLPVTYNRVMSITISIGHPFVSDHFHDLPGFTEARHGHNWHIEASFEIQKLEDRRVVHDDVHTWIQSVDYTLLNDATEFQGRNPTAELLSQWACEYLLSRGHRVTEIRIQEKANYWARCRP